MIKLIDILNEITVNNPSQLLKQDLKDLDILTEYFGEGDSGFNLNKPMSDSYSLEGMEKDGERYKSLVRLTNKYPNGKKIVTNELSITSNFIAPGAPKNSFGSKIVISHDKVEVSVPYIDENVEYFVGWFDSNSKYHPDIKNFDEDGVFIGEESE
jgi:hypothetical protein